MAVHCSKAVTTAVNRFPAPKILYQQSAIGKIIHHLKGCSKLEVLESIYAAAIKINATHDCFLMNQFITVCSNLNCMDYAVSAYTQMENPNVFVYNAIIRGFVQCCCRHPPVQSLQFYVQMLRDGISPTSYTFSSLVKACGLVLDPRFGEAVHGHIWKLGFASHVFVQTGLIDFYSRTGGVDESRRVFDEMPERDAFSWTSMVSVLARAGDLCSARRLFGMMPERKIAAWNSLIDGCARRGDVESAESLFEQMPEKDIISWTTMINCYGQNKRFGEAVGVFEEMTKNGISPDEVTMSTVISACAHLGAFDLGQRIHFYVIENRFDLDVYIGSALIDMYAKCGSLDRALLVFFKLRERNLFCWNSVIEGLSVHGYAKEALMMFRKMEREKITPNGVTFISVLSACTHAGLVDEGRKIFESMTHDYAIDAEVEHYGCMVDLLGKAGLLEEALELIRSMKVQSNAVIWGALLGGCKLHRNLEIGQIAVGQLSVLEPGNSGHYTLLVSMYAENNRWGEAAQVRKSMKESGVEKRCPGSSWIEMEFKVHQFAASDKSHPASDEIYSLLAELDGQLKLAGHVPQLLCIS